MSNHYRFTATSQNHLWLKPKCQYEGSLQDCMRGIPVSALPTVKGTCIPWGRAEAPVWMPRKMQQYQTLILHFLTQYSCEDHFGSLLRCALCLPLCHVPFASPFTAAASTSSLSPCLLPAQHPMPCQSYLCSFSGMPDLMW